MLDVRSRAGVIAVTTSAAVLVGLPVVAFGQVPGVPQVVGGVTETANSLVQAPVAPPSPAPAPAPVPAVPAPAPQVQAPAAPSAAPKPAAQAPAAQAPAASNPGSAQARSAGSATGSSSGSAKESARRSATAADRVKARASGDAGKAPAEELSGGGSELAFASQGVDELPDDASPANLPFTGLQLALMAIIGLAALVGGVALRRGVTRAQRA